MARNPDSNTKKLCRLCLQTSDDVINIWKIFQDSTIASILAKHFWFEIHKDDGLTESLCQICWTQTKTFHEFYQKVEHFQKCFYNAINKVETVAVVDPIDVILEPPDLNIVKREVTETTFEGINSQIDKEFVSDCARLKHLDSEDRNKNIKDDDATDQRSPLPNIKYKSTSGHSKSQKDKQNAQIREIFDMKCEICSDRVEFQNLLQAKQHYRRVHNVTGYLKCCDKKFRRRCEILKHIQYHDNPYTCDQCGKTLMTKESLQCHIDGHVPLDSRAFKCKFKLCSSSFPSIERLRSHVVVKHTSKTGAKFPCEICLKNFRSRLYLTSHVRKIHKSPREYVCEICARSYKSKYSLQCHINGEHSANPQPKVQCDTCGAWLKHKEGLKVHLNRYHMGDNRVNCPICNKVVRNKHALNGHIQSTHGERHHSCVLCDKSFNTATKLKEHVATHTGEDLYDCSYCLKKFKSKANMYSHRKKTHLEECMRDKKK